MAQRFRPSCRRAVQEDGAAASVPWRWYSLVPRAGRRAARLHCPGASWSSPAPQRARSSAAARRCSGCRPVRGSGAIKQERLPAGFEPFQFRAGARDRVIVGPDQGAPQMLHHVQRGPQFRLADISLRAVPHVADGERERRQPHGSLDLACPSRPGGSPPELGSPGPVELKQLAHQCRGPADPEHHAAVEHVGLERPGSPARTPGVEDPVHVQQPYGDLPAVPRPAALLRTRDGPYLSETAPRPMLTVSVMARSVLSRA